MLCRFCDAECFLSHKLGKCVEMTSHIFLPPQLVHWLDIDDVKRRLNTLPLDNITSSMAWKKSNLNTISVVANAYSIIFLLRYQDFSENHQNK